MERTGSKSLSQDQEHGLHIDDDYCSLESELHVGSDLNADVHAPIGVCSVCSVPCEGQSVQCMGLAPRL